MENDYIDQVKKEIWNKEYQEEISEKVEKEQLEVKFKVKQYRN